jgi:hypothetical protein
MQAHFSWDLDRASQYHFREWEDGVTLFLEGENSIALINPFAAYLLDKFARGRQSFQDLLDVVCADYPDESLDTLTQLLENTLAGLTQRGILKRARS